MSFKGGWDRGFDESLETEIVARKSRRVPLMLHKTIDVCLLPIVIRGPIQSVLVAHQADDPRASERVDLVL